jgi:hypothetical protein
LYFGRKSDFFYHYTSKYCAELILRDMKLYATNARIKRFGSGVFLTKLAPCVDEDQLLVNNYIHKSHVYRTKLECAFAIKSTFLVKFKRLKDKFNPERDIWRFDGDIDLTKCEFHLIHRV